MNTSTNTIERLPIVAFEYPDSQTDRMRVRYVRAIEINADYVKGEEIENPLSQKKGVFKNYLRDRMSSQQPIVLSY